MAPPLIALYLAVLITFGLGVFAVYLNSKTDKNQTSEINILKSEINALKNRDTKQGHVIEFLSQELKKSMSDVEKKTFDKNFQEVLTPTKRNKITI